MANEIIAVGKWAVALERSSGGTVLRFDFNDRPALTLLVPGDSARQIADAINAQYENPPSSAAN